MWDNHQALDLHVELLIVAAVLTSGYFISQWAVNLPVFPFKQVNVSSGGGSDGGNRALKHVTREQIEAVVRQRGQGKFFYS